MRAVAVSLLILAACGGGHRHGTPIEGDPRKLYVEIAAGGSHEDALMDGASAGLSRVSFAVPIELGGGGEIELRMDLKELDEIGNETVCKVQVMILRLPKHSLLGVAEGNARARGTGDDAEADCVEHLGATLVKGKVRTLLRRQVRAKR